jgi:soluble lytic murein transglycosylase-like protein
VTEPAPPDLLALAHDAAHRHSLWPELVCAVVEQESAWNRWAIRYEADFYDRYIQPQVSRGALTDETEARARAFSWGLMQVMGQVAREHGFAGASLGALCDPSAGLDVGCRVLAAKIAAAEGNVPRALLLWNGGDDPRYVEAVLARAARYV